MEQKKIYFVSGIGTDVGKSYATGYLAKMWREHGKKVITQKMIQTGCDTAQVSPDIVTHRVIMSIDLLPEDLNHTTCPIRFTYPASPDLAARLAGRQIDLSLVEKSSKQLLESYDIVLLEGAGGLMVPIDGMYTMLDYVQQHNLPLIIVTNPVLGSVNHTLLSLEVCRCRGVKVDKLVYNQYPSTSPQITSDTHRYLINYLERFHPDCEIIEVPEISI